MPLCADTQLDCIHALQSSNVGGCQRLPSATYWRRTEGREREGGEGGSLLECCGRKKFSKDNRNELAQFNADARCPTVCRDNSIIIWFSWVLKIDADRGRKIDNCFASSMQHKIQVIASSHRFLICSVG